MRRALLGGLCGGMTASVVVRTSSRFVAAQSPAAGLVDEIPDLDGKAFDYDLIVIGGGSGGLAAAKRAANHGAKVALCDFVTPSETLGTKWGLGGTCVNVGCIPKKLMHVAGLLVEANAHLLTPLGGDEALAERVSSSIEWSRLQENVEMYIRSLNFGYVTSMRENNVKYINARAVFVDPHTVHCTDGKNKVSVLTARRFLLAMGGRPALPDIPGAKEHGITSDDIFRLKKDPKKTLVVGASYVALECAGFLHSIGRRATVMMRSVPLRGFDTDMSHRVVDFMESCLGMPFLKQCVPRSLEKTSSGRILVTYEEHNGNTRTDEFDTVLFATGRRPETARMGLDAAGVKLDRHGKVIVDAYDRSSARHIYAVGDIVSGGLELTPVAIHSGRLLADRLYKQATELMSFRDVPTTVFTPLEYGCVGFSEDSASSMFAGDLDVFHTNFSPLEWSMAHVHENKCYMKLLVQRSTDKVVGFHILAPNAGEIVQGVAVAVKAGATKKHFDETIGIHPTIAEDMTLLTITKESGLSPEKKGC
jgi:thioredoxin/glutathione reductase (selenoprotein)